MSSCYVKCFFSDMFPSVDLFKNEESFLEQFAI